MLAKISFASKQLCYRGHYEGSPFQVMIDHACGLGDVLLREGYTQCAYLNSIEIETAGNVRTG